MNNNFQKLTTSSKPILFVGLGNIGKNYENTRHNAGFIFIDKLIKKLNIELLEKKDFFALFGKTNNTKTKVYLAKPTTFMNDSGKSVQSILNYYKLQPTNLVLIHDDLDIELGNYKIQFGKGPKDHNGVESVEKSLGTTDFWRIRIGVESRDENLRKKITGKDFVLIKMKEDEKNWINSINTEILNSIINKIDVR